MPEEPEGSASSDTLRDEEAAEPGLGTALTRLLSMSAAAVWTHRGCGLFLSYENKRLINFSRKFPLVHLTSRITLSNSATRF